MDSTHEDRNGVVRQGNDIECVERARSAKKGGLVGGGGGDQERKNVFIKPTRKKRMKEEGRVDRKRGEGRGV